MHPHDRGTCGREKKNLTNAVETLAVTKLTDHPLLAAFYKAQHINTHSGGPVIAPWQIEPGYEVQDWIDAALALSNLPAIVNRKKATEKIFDQARAKNKDYSRLHKRMIQ